MRVIVTAQGNDLNSEVDQRLGRAPSLLLVETETMTPTFFENRPSLNLSQGAGIQTAQNIVQHHPDVVLTGNCGPKAFRVLEAAGIKVVIGVKGLLMDTVRRYLKGDFEVAGQANVAPHWE